jgi:hypothetical protein
VCTLDAVHGPAAGVAVWIDRSGTSGWSTVGGGVTGDNGVWAGEVAGDTAVVRLGVDCGRYYAGLGLRAGCREVVTGLRLTADTPIAVVTAVIAPTGGTVHVRFDVPPLR